MRETEEARWEKSKNKKRNKWWKLRWWGEGGQKTAKGKGESVNKVKERQMSRKKPTVRAEEREMRQKS